MTDFFLPDGYRCNEEELTLDSVSGHEYWTAERVRASALYQAAVYDYVAQLADQSGARSLLDIGCGVGTKLARIHARLPDLKIYGVDQPSAVEYCKKNHSFGEWWSDDLSRGCSSIEIRADVIVCADVIEHLSNPDSLLDYVRSCARPDTEIVLSTPERERMHGPGCLHSPNAQHVREWTAEEFEAYLVSRGFRVMESALVPAYRVELFTPILKQEFRRIVARRPRTNNQLVHVRVG